MPTDQTCRPQAVNRGLNDLVGLRHHGLPAGRCSRAAARAAGLSSLKGLLLLCSLQPQYCRDTDDLDCGRELQKLDVRGRLWACCLHRRAVCESCAGAHSGSAWRFRIAPQLIALSRTIDRVARVGSTVALASVCGAIPACSDRVCVISRVAPRGVVPGGDFGEFSSSPQSFPDCFECLYVIFMHPSKYYRSSK